MIFFDAKPASKTPWTKQLWVYDYRTNVHKTLKQNRLSRADFAEFIELYRADDLSQRQETWSADHLDGRWRCYDYADLIARDKTNLDIFWLKDHSLEDSDNLPAPEILAAEIVEQLQAALDEFKEVESLLSETVE